MPELPRGTVTFAFTDIEGSTDLMKALGDDYRDVLTRHRAIVREAFGEKDGIEIDTQGDAFFFVFARARDAVSAAIDVQRAHATAEWPDAVAVRVRIGLHTGEPAVHEEGYLGLDVVRAARICTAGRGGQVLLSETTRALVGSALPEGVSVFPLGERHLRGLDEPERVYELEIEGLARDEQPVLVAEAEEEAKPPSRSDRGTRFDDLGDRLAARIEHRVLASVERSLGKVAGRPSTAGDASAADNLASRFADLDERISARVADALRAKDVDPDE